VVIDSGATSHFVQATDNLPYWGKSKKIVKLPDGSTIQATHAVRLPFDTINDEARKAHVLPELKGNSLLSVPVLASNGYTTVFHAGNKGVEIYNPKTVKITTTTGPVLQGWRESSGLWRMGCYVSPDSVSDKDKIEHVQNVYDLPSLPAAIRYHHAAVGFPPKATWLKAIKCGNFDSFPSVNIQQYQHIFPNPLKQSKGIRKNSAKMLDQQRKSYQQKLIVNTYQRLHQNERSW